MISVLLGRLSAVHDNHKRIASGALLIGALTFAAKLFVAARELAIASRYGISQTVDAYQLAVTISTWLPTLLTSAMTVVLVPRLVRLRTVGSGRQFIDELNGTMLILGLGVAALVWMAAPAISGVLASTATSATLRLTRSMAERMAPTAFLTLMSGYFIARLQSRERFSYSVTEALPALTIALMILLPLGLPGVVPLVAGTLLGYLLQLIALVLLIRRGDPPIGSVRIRHRSRDWQFVYGALSLMVLGQLAMSLAAPIDQGFASRVGPGAVATIGYCNRIIALFTGAGAVVLARALLPVLSAAAAAEDHALGSRQARQWAWLLFAFGSVVALVGWVLAEDAVALVFQRGAFGPADTAAVAYVLRPALLQLPFYFGGLALVQWIAARSRYRLLLWVAFFGLIIKVTMNLVLIHFLGLAGIMLSTAIMYGFSFAWQYLYVRAKL